MKVLQKAGIDAVILDDNATKLGGVETWEHAKKCAALFQENRARIDGILVKLPNFGDGQFVDDPLNTFGSRAVAEIPDLQKLMRYVCKQGYEHHAAMAAASSAAILAEAFETYFGWEVYHHGSEG